MSKKTHIAIFNGKGIRKKLIGNKWFFSIVDVVYALTESSRPRKYWSDLKSKLIEEGSEVSAFIGQLKLLAEDSKIRETDVSDTEGIFRIIQSIPSKKAEPLFEARGRAGSFSWSPDGNKIVFESEREDHSFIGICDFSAKKITWIEPSVDRDSNPVWSPDGRQVAFI